VAVTTDFKRATLRTLWIGAQRNRVSLLDALSSFLSGHWDNLRSGLVVTATSGNGESVTLGAIAANGATWWHPAAAFMLGSEFIDRYETSQGYLADGSSDCDIFDDMLSRLAPVYETFADFNSMHRP